MSTFVTSFTTSAAFFANCATKIISVKCFGLYAGIVILCDYLLMITFLPAVVMHYDNVVCGSHSKEAEEGDGRTRYIVENGHGDHDGDKEGETPPPASTRGQIARKKIAAMADASRALFDTFFQSFIPSLLLGDYFAKLFQSESMHTHRKFREWAFALFWSLVLGSIGIYSIKVSFINPGLTVPAAAGYQLFYDEHPFEKWDMVYSQKFTTATVAGVKMFVQWWFGIEGTDNSNPWDPWDAGTTRPYPMDIYKKESQQFFWDFAKDVEVQSWFGNFNRNFMPPFHSMMMGDCNSWNATVTSDEGIFHRCCGHEKFPWEEDTFKECLDFWTANNGWNANDQGIYYDTSGKIAAIKLNVITNQDFSSSNQVIGTWWKVIEDFNERWIYSNPNLADTGLNKGWASSQLQLWDVQTSLGNGVRYTLQMSLVTASLVLLLTTKNIVVTFLSMLTISSILGCTIAVLIWEGWHLSILESVVFSVAVGLSVDFCVHYGWALLMALRENEHIERRPLIVASLREMGGSVTMGSVTTIIAGCVMLMCRTLFFLRFGTFLIVCMCFSWFFSSFFLMSCVSAIPHTKYLLDVNFKSIGNALNWKQSVNFKGGAIVMVEVGENEDELGRD